jgi:uncharacterized protein (TIGR00645 family)
MERWIERVLVAARWALVPLYLGLALLLLLFSVQFFRELVSAGLHLHDSSTEHLIIEALTLVDLALIAGLIVMVMLSGYENYVSRLDVTRVSAKFSWLAKLDTGSIKVKVAVTIVAISAIDLLKVFLEIEDIADDKLLWRVILHLTFVISAVALAALDHLSNLTHRDHAAAQEKTPQGTGTV